MREHVTVRIEVNVNCLRVERITDIYTPIGNMASYLEDVGRIIGRYFQAREGYPRDEDERQARLDLDSLFAELKKSYDFGRG